MKRGTTMTVIALLTALGTSTSAEQELQEILPVAPGGTLRVELSTGSIEVETHDEPAVEIDAQASGWGRMDFELSHDDDGVRIVGSHAGWLPSLGASRVELHARVPERFDVDLATSGGRIEVQELRGRVDAETSGGSIEVDRVEGDVVVETSGGNIRAQEIRGELVARTSGGSIHVSEVSGPVEARSSGGGIRIREAGDAVQARTSGGSVAVRFTSAPEGRLETSGGSVEVELPEHAGARIDAETSGGRVEIDPEFRIRGRTERSRVEGELNGGGALLELRTSGGNIRVRAR